MAGYVNFCMPARQASIPQTHALKMNSNVKPPGPPLLSLMTRRAFSLAAAAGCAQACARDAADTARWTALKAEIRARYPQVRQLTVTEWQAWQADPKKESTPLLIDTRSAAEFADSRLPGALHVPSAGAVLALLERMPQHGQVVLYCSVGYRSAALAQQLQTRLRGQKAPDFFNLEGSLFEWANRGLPLEDARGPTQQVHPYDARWGVYLDRNRWSRTP